MKFKKALFALIFCVVAVVMGVSVPTIKDALAQDNDNAQAAVESQPARRQLAFNRLPTNSQSHWIERAKIPGGWLVTSGRPYDEKPIVSITFVPDPNHEWDGKSIDK